MLRLIRPGARETLLLGWGGGERPRGTTEGERPAAWDLGAGVATVDRRARLPTCERLFGAWGLWGNQTRIGFRNSARLRYVAALTRRAMSASEGQRCTIQQ